MVYQELANKIVEIVPVDWSDVIVTSEINEGANSIRYLFKVNGETSFEESDKLVSKYGLSFKQEMKNSIDLSIIIKKLHKLYLDEGLESWNRMTFILTSEV